MESSFELRFECGHDRTLHRDAGQTLKFFGRNPNRIMRLTFGARTCMTGMFVTVIDNLEGTRCKFLCQKVMNTL